ncbi:MAG: class I SAM-dependent methyltransferase [Calditrichaeota bacterium]|nr:class I SAM-dependent methyltransferase [Calditrichota bacterium]
MSNTQNPHCHVCKWYHAYLFDNPLRRLIHNPQKIFSMYVKPGMTVADIGCGMGFNSIGMARLVRNEGRVIAADLQPEMLSITMKRAKRKGVGDIIETHKCESDKIGINDKFDFIVAFWVVHETPDQKAFLSEIRSILKPDGKFLLVEPSHHVTEESFKDFISIAESVDLVFMDEPKIKISKAALFKC